MRRHLLQEISTYLRVILVRRYGKSSSGPTSALEILPVPKSHSTAGSHVRPLPPPAADSPESLRG
jgi:hypothetical protein